MENTSLNVENVSDSTDLNPNIKPDDMFNFFRDYTVSKETMYDLLCRIYTSSSINSDEANAFIRIFGDQLENGVSEEKLHEMCEQFANMDAAAKWYWTYRPFESLDRDGMIRLAQFIMTDVFEEASA